MSYKNYISDETYICMRVNYFIQVQTIFLHKRITIVNILLYFIWNWM